MSLPLHENKIKLLGTNPTYPGEARDRLTTGFSLFVVALFAMKVGISEPRIQRRLFDSTRIGRKLFHALLIFVRQW